MAVTFNNTVYNAGFVGQDDGQPSASFRLDNVSAGNITVSGTVTKPGDPVTVTGTLPGGAPGNVNTLYATQYDNNGMIQFSDNANPDAGTNRYVFSNSGLAGRQTVNFNAEPNAITQYQPVCFVSGTLILTDRGEVVVEELRVGDVVVTSSGERRPIRWIGHRTIETRDHRNPADVHPIRISAGALGHRRPSQDLLISPGHAICFDVLGEVLIVASALVNGTTITQENVESVMYWHVELDSHDILVANGQPAESYLDMGTRGFFVEGDVVRLDASPDAEAGHRTHADCCRPFLTTGVIVDAVRKRLQARAEQMGWDSRRPAPSKEYSFRTPGALNGYIDGCRDGFIQGWAQDLGHPDIAICLNVVVDGAVVGWVIADEFREDLRAAGLGSGKYGFEFVLPNEPALDGGHVLEVRRSIDDAVLGSTRVIGRKAA